MIFQIGNREDTASGTEEGDLVKLGRADFKVQKGVQALGLAKIRHEGRKIVPSIKGKYQGTVNFTLGRQLSLRIGQN